jgi:hypothetical protein
VYDFTKPIEVKGKSIVIIYVSWLGGGFMLGVTPDRVSEKNPALVLFVIDMSDSMFDSNNIEHVEAAIKPLKGIAASKPGQIRFAVIGFDTNSNLILNEPLEEAQEKIPKNFKSDDGRTNLKKAAQHAKEVYREHVRSQCKGSSPLASILFFTDGGHSYELDFGDGRSAPKTGNENHWYDTTVDQFLNYPGNVICGIIDYSPLSESSDFPEDIPPGRNKVSKVTRLSNEIVDKAYAREISHPTLPNQDLESVFGPKTSLYDKLFSVGVHSVEKSPAATAAFVRLGTYSSTKSTGKAENQPDVNLNFEDEF